MEIKNAMKRVGWIMRRRPFVSAKNPHKCDEKIIPAYETAHKIPFSLVVKFKSHCETGNTKEMPQVSIITAFNAIPLTNIKM